MRYLLYVLLLYVFLPLNAFLDLITIMIFFIVFHEDERFALIFAFSAGLFLDLFNPVKLGLQTMVLTVLGQSLIFVRKFVAKGVLPITATVMVFYLIRVVTLTVAVPGTFSLAAVIATLAGFLPVYLAFNRITLGSWMKI